VHLTAFASHNHLYVVQFLNAELLSPLSCSWTWLLSFLLNDASSL
jgi:hypothetical protein